MTTTTAQVKVNWTSGGVQTLLFTDGKQIGSMLSGCPYNTYSRNLFPGSASGYCSSLSEFAAACGVSVLISDSEHKRICRDLAGVFPIGCFW